MGKGMSASSIAMQLQRLSNEATEKSFQYNTQEANTARAWQTEMSNTAHQREVADLKAAGLNPVLASNNGAQSYTTSSASAQAENAANAVGNVWSSDISARATRAAAAQSAAATRYAAAAQASAARYAATLQYDAQIKGYQNSKEINAATNTSNQKVAEIQNKKSLIGLITNSWAAENIKGLKDIASGSVKSAANVLKNRNNYLRDNNKGFSVNNLNFAGRRFVSGELRKYGVTLGNNYNYAYRLYVDSHLAGDKHSQREWTRFIDNYYKDKKK